MRGTGYKGPVLRADGNPRRVRCGRPARRRRGGRRRARPAGSGLDDPPRRALGDHRAERLGQDHPVAPAVVVAAAVGRPGRGARGVLGRTDMRALRQRIGYTSQALTDLLRAHDDAPRGRAGGAERRAGDLVAPLQRRPARRRRRPSCARSASTPTPSTGQLRTLSSGERQRVLLARAFTGRPGIVILDEPTAGLDVGGREDLLRRLDAAAATTEAPLVLVTHHLEEIPPAFDHVVLLADGRIVGLGPAAELLTANAPRASSTAWPSTWPAGTGAGRRSPRRVDGQDSTRARRRRRDESISLLSTRSSSGTHRVPP